MSLRPGSKGDESGLAGPALMAMVTMIRAPASVMGGGCVEVSNMCAFRCDGRQSHREGQSGYYVALDLRQSKVQVLVSILQEVTRTPGSRGVPVIGVWMSVAVVVPAGRQACMGGGGGVPPM